MVGPRASKDEFMAALGLTAQDEPYYRAMRDEAVKIYTLMNTDPSNLLDSIRADPSTQPPYYWHNIRPECQRWGVLEIWRTSSPHTRPLFDLGATNGEHGPNWVAGWLLYSVFRSRDARNNRNRRRGGNGNGNGNGQGNGANGNGGSGSNGGDGETEADERSEGPQRQGYYDPVRNGTYD